MDPIRTTRLIASGMALACSGFLLFAGFFGGGLHRDDQMDRTLTFVLAAVIGIGVVLARRTTTRWSAIIMGACAAAGIAWDLAIDAPLSGTWGFWAALAIAGGLCWRVAPEE